MAKFIKLHRYYTNVDAKATAYPIYVNVDAIVSLQPETSTDGIAYTIIRTILPMSEDIKVKETTDEILIF